MQDFHKTIIMNYLCKVLKQGCKIQDKKIVHKGSSIVLV